MEESSSPSDTQAQPSLQTAEGGGGGRGREVVLLPGNGTSVLGESLSLSSLHLSSSFSFTLCLHVLLSFNILLSHILQLTLSLSDIHHLFCLCSLGLAEQLVSEVRSLQHELAVSRIKLKTATVIIDKMPSEGGIRERRV